MPLVMPAVAYDLGYLSTPIAAPVDAPAAQVSPPVLTPIAEYEPTVSTLDTDGHRHTHQTSRLLARPPGPLVADIAAIVITDTADPFPISTCTKVHQGASRWPCGNWYPGVVVWSSATRTRHSARVLKARYDDSHAMVFTHTCTNGRLYLLKLLWFKNLTRAELPVHGFDSSSFFFFCSCAFVVLLHSSLVHFMWPLALGALS